MKRISITLLIILSLATGIVQAQETMSPINTGAANFLTLPSDARSAGMGSTGVAMSGSAYAIFQNAATSLFTPKKGGLGYSFAPVLRQYESGHALHSLAGFYKLNPKNAILGGFRFYHYPSLNITANEESTAQRIRPKEWAIDLGYACEVIPHLSLSITARMIHSDLGSFGESQSANTAAFDLGIAYHRKIHSLKGANWTVGMRLANIGAKLEYPNSSESIPALAKAGGAIGIPINQYNRYTFTGEIGYRITPSDVKAPSFSTGAEYTLKKLLMFRGGYHYGDKKKGDSSYATAGAGICLKGIQADFSYLFAKEENTLRDSYWISISYTL